MIKEDIKVKGALLIEVKDSEGNVKDSRFIDNLVVTSGLNLIATAIGTGSATAMSHMAMGNSSTAAALGQTALLGELGRVALTSTTVTNSTLTYIATFPAGTATGALVEAGLFNATPAGVMLSRTIFSVINKGVGDSTTVTWTITIG